MLDFLFGGLSLATGGVAGILGSVLGIGARLIPEAMKHFQDRRDKAHELEMLKLQIDSADKLAKLRMDEQRQADEYKLDGQGMAALTEAIKGQFSVTSGWAANLSASVRPVATYWLLAIYSAQKAASFWMNWDFGTPPALAIVQLWTADDIALFSGIMNFWFLDRAMRPRQPAARA